MTKRAFYYSCFLAGFMVLMGVFYQGMALEKKPMPSTLLNKSMPQFKIRLLDKPEKMFDSKQLIGQYSVLNVWATWCSTCLHEHRFWMQKGKHQVNFQLLGLNYRDDITKANAYLADEGNPYFAVLADVTGQLAIDLGVYGTPQTFLINPQGKMIYKHVGSVDEHVWQSEFVPRIQA